MKVQATTYTLKNLSNGEVLAQEVLRAQNFCQRLTGLMGRSELGSTQAMWLERCNWIHTCFMRFSLDLIFVNDEMKVEDITFNVVPWRFGMPVWKASSVFEFKAGTLKTLKVSKGDQLHVGH